MNALEKLCNGLLIVAAALFTLAFFLWFVGLVEAHMAPSGMHYDPECCSNTDCRPVAAEELIENEIGWKHLPSGTQFRKNQVKPSKDRNFHVCIGRMGTPYCVYILQGT